MNLIDGRVALYGDVQYWNNEFMGGFMLYSGETNNWTNVANFGVYGNVEQAVVEDSVHVIVVGK